MCLYVSSRFIHALGGQEEPLLCCVFHFHLSQATFIFVCVELWDVVLWIRRWRALVKLVLLMSPASVGPPLTSGSERVCKGLLVTEGQMPVHPTPLGVPARLDGPRRPALLPPRCFPEI